MTYNKPEIKVVETEEICYCHGSNHCCHSHYHNKEKEEEYDDDICDKNYEYEYT